MSDDDDKPDVPLPDYVHDNVRDLFAEPQPPDVGARGHRFDLCKHTKIDLVMKEGIAECRACKRPVELFRWMYANTEYFRRAHDNWRHTKREVARLTAEEKDLKRRVRNLKAQATRAQSRLQQLEAQVADADPDVAVLGSSDILSS